MQMYLGALVPSQTFLRIKDIPKEQRTSPYKWHDHEVIISSQETGKGLRYFLHCPNCGKRRYYIVRYDSSNYNDAVYCCKQCDPYHKAPYEKRTNLDDSDITALLDYHINKERNRLEDLGVHIEIHLGNRRAVETAPTMDDLMLQSPQYFTPEWMDYRDFLWQKPKNKKTMPFKRMLVKLQLLYELKNDAQRRQICYKGKDIRKIITKEVIDEVIRRFDSE